MLSNFIDFAMNRACYETLEDTGKYFGHIPELPGVWATGRTVADTIRELCEVLEDWVAPGEKLGHPLPEAFIQPPS